jgi:hypothetical protein
MKFKLWRKYGALNAKSIFDAFEHSCIANGHHIGNSDNINDSDVHVIWSVLFHGRMARNKDIWAHCQKLRKPVIVLEVGSIKRGTTWKVGLNGINRDAYFGEQDNDRSRAVSLGLVCKPWRSNGDFILVCGQHDKSLQWQNMPRMSNWFLETYDEIRKYTQRPIVFRPHPRCRLEHIERGLKNVHRQEPQHVNGTYDDFDMDFNNVWATVSYSSNPGTHSCVNGVPAFVSTHSLAYDVANDIDFLYDIENPLLPDRQQWLNDIAWSEFTVEEIANGLPLSRLKSVITI